MNNPGNDVTPPVRRRRRWIVVGAVVFLIAIVVWWLGRGSSVVARARLIKVGQTRDEVVALMGRPQILLSTGGPTVPSEAYIDMTMLELNLRILAEQYLYLSALSNAFPVAIEYDANQRVSRVIIQKDDD